MNEKGSVTVTLLALLPLCLAFILTVIAIFFVMRTYSANLQECRTSLMHTENERLMLMHELIGLNPEARRLRKQNAMTTKALEAAEATGVAPAIASAEAAQAVVTGMQLAFAAKQRSLLLKADTNVRMSISHLKAALKKRVANDQRNYDGPKLQAIDNVQSESEIIGVVAKPAESITPDYEPAPDFEKRETIRVTWKFWPARLLPDWLKWAEPYIRDYYIEGQCASSAEDKGNNQWRSRLTTDKQL